MQAQTTDECLVCGTETKNRCSACARAGLDLFFCSPEHQKLVWFGHKLVCGENAFPLVLPLLSAEELAVALRDLDKPTLGSDASRKGPKVSALSMAKENTGQSRSEIVSAIRYASSKSSPHAPVQSPDTQAALFIARLACPSGFTRSPRDDLLSSWARHYSRMVHEGLLLSFMVDATLKQTVLAHRFFCMLALSRVVDTCSPGSPGEMVLHAGLLSACRDAVVRYAQANFGPTALAKHFKSSSKTAG